ncbi:MAG: T9SS type A sorting domain-containing protein [candidate division Zixibacteria bacterium]|nr:T9SS type A sorting domain-containing protein [candidate division Zixibacteria bacterium]
MGRVTDMTNGNGLAAMVEITNREPAIFGMCSAEGYYSMYVPADTLWDLKASFPPDYLPVFDQMMVAENETVTVNFELEPKVEVMIMAQFANPDDVSYREFYIDGTWDNDGFYDADRSGDYLVIADDGEYPDETPGDGIFTGSIKLATDLDNTYQWALFCENYGVEDAAFMQNGAGFNVTDPGNPPDVPILQVNPSGSDPNWGFSVVGTNGLDLDLMGGVNSDPFKWGAAVELTQGLTYSFRFHIMHSSLPRYGIGGIGGDAIPYECTFTGFYDFIFNDSTDSYLVQLTGEEGPPTYLSVASGLDGHIPVAWMPPGTVESTEMIYDDGTLANGYYYYAFDAIMANMFVPPSYPCIIDSLLIHVLTEGDEYWPWPDGTHDPVKLTVWLDSNNDGMPDDSVFFAEATVPDGVGQWIRVDTPEIEVPNGTNFWIGMSNINGGGDDGIGLDIITDFPAHKWSRFDGVWGLEASFEGDHMIRAKVFTNEGISGLQYDNLPTGTRLPNSGIGLAQGGSSTHGTGATLPGLSASEEDQFPSPDMYFPKLVYGKGNRAGQDIQVLAGYNLYRSTSSGPYAQDLKINSELISETTYDDWGIDDYGPIVNGVLYYYEATAIYDVGGGDFVEIGPSNETTGQAENHPPETPLNLIGDVVDHDVYLDWSPNGDYDIDEYNIYRRDYNQSEFNLVGTVVHPDTSYTEFVASDGIYRYKITAVDREDAESGFSGNVDLAVGLIPPGILQATEDLDSRIDLRWRNPGGRDILEDLNILFLISDYPDAQTEVEDFLINSGEVESADFFDAQNGTPTFEDIQDYDLVLTWANYPYFDPTGIGDVLAEYVEEGGAVVACEFAFYGSWAMGGRFMDEYSPFTQANAYFVNVSLGDYDPGHPLMQDVNDVGEYFCSDVTAHEYAETVASWDNGWPFVAYNTDAPSVVAINGYVGSPDRQWTGDMLQVVLNSVLFTASGGGIEPDGFNLYKADNESGPFELLAELPGTDNEYSDDPVPNNTDYYYQVTAVYNSEESEPSNTAHGYAVPGARLAVSPDSYELFVSQGQIETRNLYISNEGGLPMDFDITVIQDGRIMLRNPHKSPNDDFGFEKDPFERYSRSDDEAKQTEPGGDNPPMTLDSGGPDEFGYTWVDSNEPGGPEFSWVDIEGRGTPLVMSDDDNQGPFDLDFNFSFYGNSFDNIRICSNGWLSFTSTNYDYTNYPIPDPNYPTNLIALFWDDMNPADGGQILYWAGDDSFVVSWINVPRYSAGGSFTYQAILTSDGSITYQYDYMEGELASATIGIQNEDGTIGLQVAYDQYYVEEGLAVKIQPGWLTVTPSFGHVVEGGTDSVEVKFDASSLDAGDYTGSLTVYGWDRYHQEDPITVPVDLHVAPTDVPSSPDAILPVVFRLHQNYPNPFNPVTSIQYDLPVNCHVKLDVINILGQRVRTVIDKNETAGYKSVVWDGKNDSGLRVTSGIYFYKISAGDYNNVKKMTVIK